MELDIKSKKLEILLHYESAFRDDWRLLHRLRILVAGFYIGLVTGLIGWMVKLRSENNISDEKDIFVYLLIALSVTATACMGWFGSSINTLKRFIVQIEKALKLMDEGYYMPSESIVPQKNEHWGERTFWAWGKGIIASILISSFLIGAVAYI